MKRSQQLAYQTVRKAVRDRLITKPEVCERCGHNQKHSLCAHHNDYEKPLEVEWLCFGCHNKIHSPERQYRVGEDNQTAKLSTNDVHEIRRRYREEYKWGEGTAEGLALEYEVSVRHIFKVISGERRIYNV